MKTPELKPCPFCGGKAERNYINNINKWLYEARCPCCGCGTDYFFTAAEAIEAWNRRYTNE